MVCDEDLTGFRDEEQTLPEGEDRSTTSECTGNDVIVTQEKTAGQTESTQTEGEPSDGPDGGKVSKRANKKAKQDQRNNKGKTADKAKEDPDQEPTKAGRRVTDFNKVFTQGFNMVVSRCHQTDDVVCHPGI
jgi:hypothetical protein